MNLHCFLSFTASDAFLGKVDKGSLSQQTLMELLISGFTKNKEKICGDSKEMKDISEWKGVTLNHANEVFRAFWPFKSLEGSVELQWLPLTVIGANFASNRLTGTVDLTCLPDALETLYLSYNTFGGTVDLTKLPPNMKNLSLNENRFYGKIDFSHLAKSTIDIDVSNTDLEGEVSYFAGWLITDGSNVKDLRKK